MRLGRVLGIPVYLSASWLILAVLIVIVYSDTVRASLPALPEGLVYVVAFSFVVTLCLSVFLHELGHALTSRHYGIGVRGITLEMLGGYTEMEEEAPRPGVEAKVALAGPAVSLVLGGIGVALVIMLPGGNLGHELAFQFAVSNIIVAVFNALPGLPLDGGRALRALVWSVRGDKHVATRVAGYTGRIVAALTLLAGVWLFYASGASSIVSLLFTGMVAMVLWAGAGQAIRVGEVGGRIHLLTVADLIRPVTSVPTGTPLSEALRRAEETAAMGVLVVDSSDRPVALMHGHAARQVPLDRRPWVTVDAVSRDLEPGAALGPEMRGEQIINAIRARPSTEYVVMSEGEVRGVVVAADIARVLDPRTIRRPYPTSDNGAPS
ncbi:peptidase M50 [Actinorhabdospora filicis]|uniref:Zinc metalloprotease n=1 Tax=Actinorhabdospora filicis TaxID=1785913 RepID=A0A9W6SNR2_9ACTN|nr:peptidase M50 [Actinorhabdospora filicis]